MPEGQVTVGERITELSARHPDDVAVISVAANGSCRQLTWADLDARSSQAANALAAEGTDDSSILGIGLPHGLEHVVLAQAGWKLGSLVVPIDPQLTDAEGERVVHVMRGRGHAIGRRSWATLPPGFWQEPSWSTVAPTCRGTPRSASASGGSTGRPRIVVRGKTWTYADSQVISAFDALTGLRERQVQLVMLPLHAAGFTGLHHGLAADHTIVLMERFVPRLVPQLIDKFRVNLFRIVPTMMKMILEVPELLTYDLSSVEAVHHGSGPCLESVKRAWLDLVGPEAVWEDYSMVERIGWVGIRGDEWVKHPGSVGKPDPAHADVRILDESRNELPAGHVGEIFLRSPSGGHPVYVGAGARLAESDGYLSVGDLGYLDDEGYLFLTSRKNDVINVGGFNVYPMEVEAVLMSHPAIRDAAVVARTHDYLGQVPYALVVPVGDPPNTAELREYCRGRLSGDKVPVGYEFVTDLGRTPMGKLSRRNLAPG